MHVVQGKKFRPRRRRQQKSSGCCPTLSSSLAVVFSSATPPEREPRQRLAPHSKARLEFDLDHFGASLHRSPSPNTTRLIIEVALFVATLHGTIAPSASVCCPTLRTLPIDSPSSPLSNSLTCAQFAPTLRTCRSGGATSRFSPFHFAHRVLHTITQHQYPLHHSIAHIVLYHLLCLVTFSHTRFTRGTLPRVSII